MFCHYVSKESTFCCVKTKVKVKLCDLENAYEWVQFLVKFQDLEVLLIIDELIIRSFTNNNEFFPMVFQGFSQNNK